MLPASTQHSNWHEYVKEENYVAYMQKLEQDYKKTSFYPGSDVLNGTYTAPMGFIEGASVRFGLWMPGVALLAQHLAEKKDVKNLFVASTIEAFSVALRTHLQSQEVFRFAFIVSPSFSGCVLRDYSDCILLKNFPQHKVAVVFEKNAGDVKMAILDSMPVGGQKTIDPSHLTNYNQEDLWDGIEKRGNFNAPELISRAFFKACENLNLKSTVYRSHVVREETNGDVIFALYDAISFLKNPNFFHEIKSNKEFEIPIKQALFECIVALPSVHMRGTQSSQVLNNYEQKEPELFKKPFPQADKTLKDSLEHSHIIVPLSTPAPDGQTHRLENHFITNKEIKYYTWVVKCLDENPEAVKRAVEKILC